MARMPFVALQNAHNETVLVRMTRSKGQPWPLPL